MVLWPRLRDPFVRQKPRGDSVNYYYYYYYYYYYFTPFEFSHQH